MPSHETDAIEKKSYTKVFFVFGSLFFLVSAWAFYDEVISRRSWKDYQREFNSLELTRLKEEYQKAKKAIDPEEVRKIGLEIEKAEVAMEGKEFRSLVEELHEREILLSDAKQRTGFAKADQDEVYYEWKHHQEAGKVGEAETFKKEYRELEERLTVLKEKEEEARAEADRTKKAMEGYHAELKKWQKELKKVNEPLEKIEKKMAAVKARSLDIRQVVIDDLGKGGAVNWGTVDRCESCHTAINRDGFENEKNPFRTHPHRTEIFGRHPIEKFGCTTCHGGQGRATQIKGKPLHEGDFVHGFVHHWPEPLLRGDWKESSCNKCHQDQWRLDHAPTCMAGKKLFWNLGCTGCHNVKGFENAPKVGPSLKKVGDKVLEEWLMQWIKNPRDYLPKTKMPTAPLDIEEPGQTEKVVAYLLESSEKYSFPYGRFPGGDPEAGKKVFETVSCYGCHTLGGKGTGLAAALDKIGSKTSPDWLYNWIRNPKTYLPEGRMPDLRLTPKEAADVTAYLMQQGKPVTKDDSLRASLKDPEKAKKGFLLVSQFGCYGCHDIKGFENTSKLSVDLTTFGKKEIFELDFGDTKVPRRWEDWLAGKLKDPRMYLTEKTTSKMPDFGLTDGQIHSLVVFLKGMKKEEVPERYLMTKIDPRQQEIDDGRRMIDRLNCKGCHTVEGEGRLIEPIVGADKTPPVLDGIGARVRPDWMFHFLKDPSSTTIRPWIDVRMPTFHFSDQQANTVIRYFSALDKVPPAFSTLPAEAAESVAAGAKLASQDYFSCYSCHIQGGKTPPSSPEQWGPDLAMARERIRPDFIPEWVKDPQRFTPGVKMPAFLPSDDAAPPDILDGNRQKQAEALRDYLMSLHK